MVNERENRRADFIPTSEMQGQICDVELGLHEAVVVRHDVSGDCMRIRRQNNVKVYVAGNDGDYEGRVPMQDGKEYKYRLKGKKVAIKPLGLAIGRKRKFELDLAEGLSVVEPEISEAELSQVSD